MARVSPQCMNGFHSHCDDCACDCHEATDKLTKQLAEVEAERDALKRAIAPVWPLDKPIQQYVELCARYRENATKVTLMDAAVEARKGK